MCGARRSLIIPREQVLWFKFRHRHSFLFDSCIHFFSLYMEYTPYTTPPPAGLGKGLHPDGDLVYLMTVSFHSIVSIYYI